MLCPKTDGSYFVAKICSMSKKIVIVNYYLVPLVKDYSFYSRILRMSNSIKAKKIPLKVGQTDIQTGRQANLSNILYTVRLSTYTKASWPSGLRRWT